jgi:hypothetical protein
MGNTALFIRRRGDECSIVKIHPDGREEILEHGLTLIEAETLYFVCIGEPVHEARRPPDAGADGRTLRGRPRQLAFKF